MQKSNKEDEILNEKIKKLKNKIKKGKDPRNLMDEILPGLKDICSEMGKGKFSGIIGGNKEAKKIENQLKTYDKWEIENELYPNTLAVAQNIQKIKELEEIGKLLESEIEPMVVADLSLEILKKQLQMYEDPKDKSKTRTTHSLTRGLLRHLGSIGKKLGNDLDCRALRTVSQILKGGDVGLTDDLKELMRKLVAVCTEKTCRHIRLGEVVDDLTCRYKNALDRIEAIIDQMVNIYNERRAALDKKPWEPNRKSPEGMKQWNALYEKIEGIGYARRPAEDVVTALISASDGKFDSNNSVHKELVTELSGQSGKLQKLLNNLQEQIP